jgi:uncharacterized protein with HEPN domain
MSKNRSELAYLRDILDAIQAIQDFTRGYDYELFVSDRKTRDAVVRNLEVIGEAVKKVSRSVKARYPQVEWKSIAGLRDVLIHDYFGVNYREVWAIVSEKIEPLKEEIEKILQAEQAS